jgi:hypothetical protein
MDLRFVLRAIDSASAEIEAAVADGDVDESVQIDLAEAQSIIEDALKGR